MENKEDVLNALEDFIKKPSENIPEILECYLKHIAKTGTTVFPWGKLKPLFEQRLSQAISEFHKRFPMDKPNVVSANVETLSFDVMRDRILEAIKTFSGAPFTIQRLCELIITPGKHYRSTDKYLRGIEKNIMVVSTVDPFGRKIVCESSMMVNGTECTPSKPSSFPLRMESPERVNNSPFVPPAPSNSPVVSSNWVTENGAQCKKKSELVTTLFDSPASNKEEKRKESEEEEMSVSSTQPPQTSESSTSLTSTATVSSDVAADDIETRRSSGGFETSSYSAESAEPSPKKPRLEETTSDSNATTTTTKEEEEKEERTETPKEEEEEVVEEAKEEVEVPPPPPKVTAPESSDSKDSTSDVSQSSDSLSTEKSMETD